ncbi:hypothetical protein [Planotetraspora sp. GP83]|uniref:hypothetical protein n=1 Tax=Planotetraspora sp. GP83 TaxID=3156264 RepID=UPI00351773E1
MSRSLRAFGVALALCVGFVVIPAGATRAADEGVKHFHVADAAVPADGESEVTFWGSLVTAWGDPTTGTKPVDEFDIVIAVPGKGTRLAEVEWERVPGAPIEGLPPATVPFTGKFTVKSSDPGGTWEIRALVSRQDSDAKPVVFRYSFPVVGRTLTLTASPAEVAKGGRITLTGTAKYGTKPLAKTKIAVYFKKKRASSWKLVAYVRSTTTGRYAKAFVPAYDGYWRTRLVAFPSVLSPFRFVDVT